ncbi:MAG: glycoside hydrolase domain-containing protein, partial [Armatimonadota bacterium]
MYRLLPLLLMLLPVVLLAGTATDRTWPRVTIARMAAPVLDGVLAPGEWDQAVTLGGFHALPGSELVGNPPLVKVAWSEQGLMVGAWVPLPPGERAQARVTDFDGTVWEDDCVEVHLDRGHRHQENHQFIVNALGTRFDALGGDRAFNADWQAAARNETGQWSCELLIPWAAVGAAPAPGDLDGFNVIINSSYLGGILTVSPLTRSAHETANYLHLVYGEDLAVSLEGLDADRLQDVGVRALGTGQATLTYVLSRSEDGDWAEVERTTLTLTAPAIEALPVRVPEEQGMPRPGSYVAQYMAEGPDGLLLVRSVPFTVAPPLSLTAQAFVGEGYLNVVLEPSAALFPPADTALHLTATVAATILYDQAVTPAPSGPTAVTLTDVPAGTLTLLASATNRRTGLHYRSERSFDSPLHPVWLGTQEGLTDEVPPPWTALQVDGAESARPAIRCWGRRYGFARGLLPSGVTTREAEVLQAPIALSAQVDGRPLEWTTQRARVQSARPNAVTLIGSASSPALEISGTTRVEYDGMIRCDLTLTPTRPGVTVQSLTLDIPLKPEHARYLYHFPGRWGSVANSAYLPAEGWSNSFRPFMWLGDEDRGFCWFCESDQNWFPLDNQAALTIERGEQATMLRCHDIADELKVTEPLS